jgi:alpha-L-fucosidase 2
MDSNFGYTSGVTEMLLQSHLGEIHLLPALPDAWQNGSVTGLKARGGVEVSIFWKNGQLEKAIFKADKNGNYTLRYAKNVKNVFLSKGKEIELKQKDWDK